MLKYIIIKDDVIVNIIVWDGISNYVYPDDSCVMEIMPDNVGIGWKRSNGLWVKPIDTTIDVIRDKTINKLKTLGFTSEEINSIIV